MIIHETQLADGSVIRRPGTTWENKTGVDVTLDLSRPVDWDRLTGERIPPREEIVTLAPGESITLPASLDVAVQDERCQRCTRRVSRHPEMLDPRTKAAACTDLSHAPLWSVVGGLGPQLRRVLETTTAPAPKLHPSLDPSRVVPSASPDEGERDARLRKRARGAS